MKWEGENPKPQNLIILEKDKDECQEANQSESKIDERSNQGYQTEFRLSNSFLTAEREAGNPCRQKLTPGIFFFALPENLWGNHWSKMHLDYSMQNFFLQQFVKETDLENGAGAKRRRE